MILADSDLQKGSKGPFFGADSAQWGDETVDNIHTCYTSLEVNQSHLLTHCTLAVYNTMFIKGVSPSLHIHLNAIQNKNHSHT